MFSLYGAAPKYTVGAVRNCEDVARFLPGWRSVFYVGRSVPVGTLLQLRERGATVIQKAGSENAAAMFWRFEAFSEFADLPILIRDCDCRFSQRELRAIEDWLASGADFHLMRDHPWHNMPILGGLWGAREQALAQMSYLISLYSANGEYGDDQRFLYKHIYPLTHRRRLVHDAFFWKEWDAVPFPTERAEDEFVGEAYDEFDQPEPSGRAVLRQYRRSPCRRLVLRLRDLRQRMRERWNPA